MALLRRADLGYNKQKNIFGKLQTTEALTKFDTKQVINNDGFKMAEMATGGSSITYDSTIASSKLEGDAINALSN